MRIPLHHAPLLAILLAVAALLVVGAGTASGHSELETTRSEPAPGRLYPIPPERVDLWFTEALDDSSGAAVYDEQRHQVDDGRAIVDPADPTHLSVGLTPLVDGVYTVAWHTTSREDSHLIRGTFTFRVGQSRLPGGAATTEGEEPGPIAVGLRWLGIAGLALVAGWFLIGLLGVPPGESRQWLSLAGAVAALVADLGQVPIQAAQHAGLSPPAGIADTLNTMPASWFVRVGIETLLLILVAGSGWRPREGRALPTIGTALTALALITLTFTSHAAASQHDRPLTMAANAMHITTAAFWIGGVIQFAVTPSRRCDGGRPLRRFSGLALVLAPVTILTGVAGAGLLLPSVDALWRSDYGRLLLIKTAAVLGILGLAWINRRYVQHGLLAAARLLRSLRTEALIGAVILLVAAILALSAPPAPATAASLHLRMGAGDGRFAHLVLDPTKTGDRDVRVWVSAADDQPEPSLQPVDATFTMLERPVDAVRRNPTSDPDGTWLLRDVPLALTGWWQADVRFAGSDAGPVEARFVFLLPDATFAEPEQRDTDDPQAERLFQTAFADLLSLRTLQTRETLGDGTGNSVETTYQWVTPDRMTYRTSSGNESVAIDNRQFYRTSSTGWSARDRVTPLRFPDAFQTYYSGADQFTLGREVEIEECTCQVITFHVPPLPDRDESWYAWWIDTTTGELRYEAMAARYHYMTTTYVARNAPVEITAPVVPTASDAAAVASPPSGQKR